jgi:phage tail-like protein
MPKARTDTGDAIAPARFSITVDGVEVASFSELVAIVSEQDPEDFAGMLLRKLPGKRNPPTVTLRRALTADTQLGAWHESGLESRASEARKSAALDMYNTAGEPVARYHLESAWVPKIEITALKAGSNEVLYETVTLACERLQRLAV